MDRKSNKVSYAEKRSAYYDTVVRMFAEGMTAKEILKYVPVGKSTIYRWFDEYRATNAEANIRKSPKLAMQTIAGLNNRVRELEALLKDKAKADDKYQSAIRALTELDNSVADIQAQIKSLMAELRNK